MKNCVHVWKSRNLTWGIPEKYVKEMSTLVWGFIRGGGINQIDRKVCCLAVENGGMGMINIQ
jgi:hypothetical protein